MVAFLLLSSASIAGAQDTKPVTRISQELAEIGGLPSAAAARGLGVPGSFSASPHSSLATGWPSIPTMRPVSRPTYRWTALQHCRQRRRRLGDDRCRRGGRSERARGRAHRSWRQQHGSCWPPRLRAPTDLGDPIARRCGLPEVCATRSPRHTWVRSTSQGDHALRADVARSTFGLDGSGVKVGVLSNSYNCQGGADADKASGDLPASVEVIQDETDLGCASGTDEGRAMLQIVHDVAPGADLAFATARVAWQTSRPTFCALRAVGRQGHRRRRHLPS